jgi:hypothetical protein
MSIRTAIWPALAAVVRLAAVAQLAFGMAPAAPPEATCFGDLLGQPYGARIARNTVFIADVGPDGTVLSAATGFVVRGVGGARIVTAAHVVDPADRRPDTIVMVFLSDGVALGVPRVTVATSVQRISIADTDLMVRDVAVLDIVRFSSAAARDRFDHLDGLVVRPGGTLLVGETSGPTGVVWGYSGGPAVDGDGQVVGVLIGADFRGRTTLNMRAIQDADSDGRPQRREVTLPNRSLVVVEPLQAPQIMDELGLSAAAGTDHEETPVVLAGFPFTSCASTTARLQPAASLAGATLLRKWQLIDQTGAWWLLPSLSVRKLRLAPG